MSILDDLRVAAHRVSDAARLVRLDPDGLDRLAADLGARPPAPTIPDVYFRGDEATTARYVLVLETVNFGSGWFPELAKRPGLSGHLTVASALTDLTVAGRLWSADELCAVTAMECAEVFGQPGAGPAFELMGLFAVALNDLGVRLVDRYGGDPLALIDDAGRSAERLVGILDGVGFFHDVGRYRLPDGTALAVPFYKRAQLCSATLSLAFDGHGAGAFDDLDRLTMFADNLVPHVLWCDGALTLDPQLERRIAAGEVLPAGGPEEVELRAVAVDTVEQLVARLRAEGVETSAMAVDTTLWSRGQGRAYKARPRPRIRTTAF